MLDIDRLYTSLATAEYQAGRLKGRLGDTLSEPQKVHIAMGKDVYRYLVSESGFDSATDSFGYWMGYKICVINESACGDQIFPVITDARSINISNCEIHDKLLAGCTGDEKEKGAVIYELKDMNGRKFFVETEMTVAFYPSSCAGIGPIYPTEQEVDDFLIEYKKQ